jgi:hypothetical protein
MAKKVDAMKIDWKALEKAKGEVVTTGTANVIDLGKGDSFIGKYLGTEQIQIGDKDPFTSLHFETEKGVQSISGMQLVQQMRMIELNSIVRVTKSGTKKTASGNKCGQFTVELLQGKVNEKEKEAIKKEIQAAVAKKNKSKKKSKKKGKK